MARGGPGRGGSRYEGGSLFSLHLDIGFPGRGIGVVPPPYYYQSAYYQPAYYKPAAQSPPPGYFEAQRTELANEVSNELNLGGAWDGVIHNKGIPVPGDPGKAVLFYRTGEDSYQIIYNNPNRNAQSYIINGNAQSVHTALDRMRMPVAAGGGVNNLVRYIKANGTPANQPPTSQPAAPVNHAPPVPSAAAAPATAPTTPAAPREPVTQTPLPPIQPSAPHAPPRNSMNVELAQMGQATAVDAHLGRELADKTKRDLGKAAHHRAGSNGAGFGEIYSAGPHGGDAIIIERDSKTGAVDVKALDPITFKPREGKVIHLGTNQAKIDAVLDKMKEGGIAALQNLFQPGQRPAAAPRM